MPIVRKTLIGLIKVYQKTLSPILGNCCCFYPTCSNYTIDALNKHGAIKGIFLSLKRICKCHPGSECKIDYVP